MRTQTLAAALLAATALAPASAQDEDAFPAEPPAVGEPRGFDLPETETYELKNGLTVTMVQYGNVPKVIVRAVVRAGNVNDGDQPWIADLTGEMLEQGAGDLDAGGVAEAAAAMGGELGIGVGTDRTFVTLDVLSEHVGDAVGLMADVLRDPALPEGEVDRLKADLVRNLSVAKSQPGTQADEAFGMLTYPGHPYAGALPSAEKIEGYGIEDVRRFHEEEYGAARTHLYVVGQFDERRAKRAIRKAFAKWEAGEAPLVMAATAPSAPEVVLVDRPGSVQSTLRLGKRVPAVDASVDLDAANTLLGGYFSSRITRNIREDKGYTYSPYSTIDADLGAAAWYQAGDIQIQSTGPALSEILTEIERMRGEAPSEAEVDAIRNYLSGVFVLRLASRGGLASQLAYTDFHGLGASYLETYVDKVRALTGEDMQAAAEAHLDPEAMHLVVVGDVSQTRPQIAEVPIYGERLGGSDGEDADAPAEESVADED